MSSRAINLLVVLAALVGAAPLLLDPDPDWLRNLIRAVVMIEAVWIFVLVAAIGHRYFLNWRTDRTKARLLPHHVVMLCIYTLLVVISGATLMIRAAQGDSPFRWYATPLLFPAFTAAALGLWSMVAWLPNRTAPPTDHGARRATDRGHNERATDRR